MFMVDTGGNGGANGLVVTDSSGKLLANIGTSVDGHYIDGNGLAFGPNGRLYEITNSFANGADPQDRISVLAAPAAPLAVARIRPTQRPSCDDRRPWRPSRSCSDSP